jgi:hypothetical protein
MVDWLMAGFSAFWTDDKIAQLETLAGANIYTGQEMADILGYSRNGVIGKCRRMGFKMLNPASPKVLTRTTPIRPKPPSKPLPIAPQIIDEPPSLNLTMEELSNAVCRYPHGDSDFRFCGQPVDQDGPYCAAHRNKCRVKPLPRRL